MVRRRSGDAVYRLRTGGLQFVDHPPPPRPRGVRTGALDLRVAVQRVAGC